MSVMEQWHIPHKHNKHTGAQYEPVLLFPRSQLSHWGVSHLSCPITADTAVKLSNKSVSKGSSAPPADRLTGWMTGCLFLALPELQLGLRYQRPEHGQKGARGSIKIYVSGQLHGLMRHFAGEGWAVVCAVIIILITILIVCSIDALRGISSFIPKPLRIKLTLILHPKLYLILHLQHVTFLPNYLNSYFFPIWKLFGRWGWLKLLFHL